MVSNKAWSTVDEAWEKLTKRERLLLFFTASVLPLMLSFVMVLEPALDRMQGVDGQIASLEHSVRAQEKMLRMLQDADLPDPNAKAHRDLKALVNRLDVINSDVDRFARNLVGPEQMLGLLHSVLGPEKDLKLIEAYSLPVEPLVLNKETEGTEAQVAPRRLTADAEVRAREKAMQEAVIYIHPFEMQLQGSYEALYRYLQSIEALHQGFFWDRLEYTADKYPNATIRLRVHTLSTEESWLGA
ncbi:MAG: type II secretion system protein M [Oceanospirillaceae bacterium]|nr:type II secretion system protein M [Oceanospirillaceae bacterium]